MFDSLNFGYSTKNIPIGKPVNFIKRSIEMTEHLIKRMRWKAFFYLNPNIKTDTKETFGFKSKKPAPQIKELEQFEKSMLTLTQNLEFRPYNNDFLSKLKTDIDKVKNEDKVLVKADKTTNYYKLEPNNYTDLLHRNITKNYSKASTQIPKRITATDKKIAKQLGLDDRIERLAHKEAFITLKDHKPNFQNNPNCRLINPTKSEIGIISKKLLDNINKALIDQTKVKIWKNTQAVVDWFNNIPNKNQHTFISFDVCDFYPSITEELMTKALDYAAKHTNISTEDREIITHAKKSLLFHKDQPWTKKESDNLFDVTMGSYDGAETCTLVGTYLLTLLPKQLKDSIGLYRDDGLAACKANPRTVDKLKKEICAVFKKHNLKITIEANKKIIDFLDVTFDLTTGNYRPYTKPGNTILYVHSKSNHPPSILKNIPDNINKRLISISSNKEEFDKAKAPYQQALANSGYNHTLQYKPDQPTKKKQKRHKQVIWYNPPYSANVRTNIGRQFINIIKKCFPKDNKLHKIFNTHTLRLSYSCMPNMKKQIDSHNKQTLTAAQQTETTTDETCNCRRKNECPLDGDCKKRSIIYQATVTRQDSKTDQTYIGLCETDFKARYANHKASFNHESKRNQTELSKHIWHLKEHKIDYVIKWKIIKTCKAYSNTTKKCNLCLFEKYMIICKPEKCTLNKRNEFASTCRHARSYLLSHS